MARNDYTRITVNINTPNLELFDNLAKIQGMTRSNLLNLIISKYNLENKFLLEESGENKDLSISKKLQ